MPDEQPNNTQRQSRDGSGSLVVCRMPEQRHHGPGGEAGDQASDDRQPEGHRRSLVPGNVICPTDRGLDPLLLVPIDD